MRTIDALNKIMAVLIEAQKHRKTKTECVPNEADGRSSPEWVLFDRRAVLAEVNAIRAERGKQPIDERTLLRKAEWQAEGHSDYTSKYALYAAELALGGDDAKKA